MKKKTIITALLITLIVGAGTLFACAPQENAEAPDAVADKTEPTLQPAGHEGRFEGGGGAMCEGCHGYDSANGDAKQSGALVVPESHYVDGSYDASEMDPNRMQCITCHPLAG